MKTKFNIKGMHCNSCANRIKEELEENGVSCTINFNSGIAKLEFDEKKISEKRIKNIIEQLGYSVE